MSKPEYWTGQRNPSEAPSDWDACEHQWRDFDALSENEVRCHLCGVPGDVNRETGEVYWPAT
jgi:hypothetical protein